jgi:hypothetical protein
MNRFWLALYAPRNPTEPAIGRRALKALRR